MTGRSTIVRDESPSASEKAVPRRDPGIDGWRAVAVLCVILAHTVVFRLSSVPDGPGIHQLRVLADPLAELGVQIFFVISGYIITSLMLRESGRTGAVSIAAFYARRTFRILPPLFAYYAALVALSSGGMLTLEPASLASSATFTCNTGIVECQWWVAHTWSLAVEEQFYLFWPLLFSVLPGAWRVRFLGALLAGLVLGAALQPPTSHSNFTSFACLAAGALVASSPWLKAWYLARPRPLAWLLVCAIIGGSAFAHALRPYTIVLPLLLGFLIFGGTAIGWVRAVLVSPPLQWIGLISYSLYLWQQLFLAKAQWYGAGPPHPVLLPIAAMASYWLIEKPFIRLGHKMSQRLKARQEMPHTAVAEGA